MPEEVVDRLTEAARKKGLSLQAYLLETVLERADLDRTDKRRRGSEAAARIMEIQRRADVVVRTQSHP